MIGHRWENTHSLAEYFPITILGRLQVANLPMNSLEPLFLFNSHGGDFVFGGLHVPIPIRTCQTIEEDFRGMKGRKQLSRLH